MNDIQFGIAGGVRMGVRSVMVAVSLVVAIVAPSWALDSDDFNRANLDPTRWTLVNPLGDGRVAMVGAGTGDAQVVLSIPEGPSHDPWNSTNKSLRIMQPVTDADLELEAKFDSEPSLRYQMQGIVVEQDSQNWLRFDALHDGTSLRIFAGATVGGSSSPKVNVAIVSGAAAFIRVGRVGNEWTVFHSADGATWSTAGVFSHVITVNSAGVFVANHASSGLSPAVSASIDYCFETSAPLVDDSALEPDTWAPLIHRIAQAVAPSELTVSWATDEPALGTVEYGLTMGYELGSISDGGGTNEHAITLPGLTSGDTFHYRILSEDALAQASATDNLEFTFDPEGPTIDVWYGTDQSFGQFGRPQVWVNIMGDVSDVDGVSALEYTLNGSPPVALTVGPDGRRLVSAGDFNVDLATDDLLVGINTVVITATDGLNNVTMESVTVNYQAAPIWPLPYAVDWSTLTGDDEIQDVAQVVDGKWTLDGGNLRTVEPGYDRLVAMGDMAWDNHEVLVPITIHTQPGGYGAGILFRWNGHTDTPVVCNQPKCGYLPLGAILWARSGRIEIFGNGGSILDTQSRSLTPGVTYWFRGRVETNGLGGLYRLKVWEDGQAEPVAWDITGQENLSDPQSGSVLLITHQADVSFGNVSITELAGPPNLEPVANNDTAFVSPLAFEDIEVLANDTDVDGTLAINTVSVTVLPAFGTALADSLTGLITYTNTDSTAASDSFQYTVEDNDGAVSNAATVTVYIGEQTGDVVSDDFNQCELDPGLWSVVNPVGDGTVEMVGAGSGDAHLALSLPAGSAHDAWGGGGLNETVRVMQSVLDVDFRAELKFNAEPVDGFNDQGFLVEQDADNWLRFDVYHSGSALKAFIGSTSGGSNTSHLNGSIPVGTASYLRLERTGNDWTFSYSPDGTAWTVAGALTHALNVGSVGVFAGNPVAGLAFTSEVDYMFSVNDPITPEDGELNAVGVNVVGNGNVVVTPNEASYACGQVVSLTAIPDVDWVFDGWSGDLAGTDNPGALVVDGPMQVSATFVPDLTAVDGPAGLGHALLGVYPNPFNPSTRVSVRVAAESLVRVDIFDAAGRRVRSLLNDVRPAGDHMITWDGRSDDGGRVGSGVYHVRYSAGGFMATRKLALIK